MINGQDLDLNCIFSVPHFPRPSVFRQAPHEDLVLSNINPRNMSLDDLRYFRRVSGGMQFRGGEARQLNLIAE